MYGPVLVSPGGVEELADYVVRKFSVQMVRDLNISSYLVTCYLWVHLLSNDQNHYFLRGFFSKHFRYGLCDFSHLILKNRLFYKLTRMFISSVIHFTSHVLLGTVV